MLHKTIKAETTDAGRVKALFSTFDVIDHDGDVTLPGAFENGQKVRISAFNHTSWQGALPVGKGTIREQGDGAVMEGEFFMDTTHGKDAFLTVKGLEDIGEWSYGFDIIESEPGTKDGRDVRFLKKLKVHEVCPVLLGAGIGTRTLVAKAKDLTDEELKERAQEACEALLKRGLALPEDLVAAVRKDDADRTENIQRRKQLATIAALNGIDIGGTN